jgi:hypothetical protein
MNDQLTSDTMQLNDVPPPGFTAPGKSLINEVEKLRGAVLLLCELQKQLTVRVEEALTPITKEAES